ncbi:penicillin-binding protein A [Gottschalkia purinilytica]|uniref:Penicillin-binding protein A n=1 Tax=Gottschalkia purinilytica TaxID=1503 RepID=A0A0L0WDM1_GOTPU|nr:penicillin-binding transpeptidase domain-containing protein [Gottschalkia purinilytica]KNF09515.1 penicillin-binding protein A [Gottschalkia purinilytica]
MNTESKRIISILVVLCTLFISLIVYLSYFEIFVASGIKDHYYNRRRWIGEDKILRGKITDRDGKILAYSEKEGETKQSRNYNYGSLYGHIIGYSYKEYGRSGLESKYNKELLNLKDSNPIEELKNILASNKEKYGNDLVLTIKHELQKEAYDSLHGKKGSIVLMNPKTGEVYAMASNPTFNPSTMKQNWESIVESQDSPLLNRATMGLYAPGSIFKVITATGALENTDIKNKYNCEGSINLGGFVLNDYQKKGHGKLTIEQALTKSCNTSFAQIGLQLGQDRLKEVAEKYMLNKEIPFDLQVSKSTFSTKSMDKAELGLTSIGQGKTLVTPLNMAMVASAIANEGQMVKPILVKEVQSKDGEVIKENFTEVLSEVTSNTVAEEIKDMMVNVVKEGTGKSAKIRNVEVAGKTGTAENQTGKSHAWFIGFAPADDPEVAVAVILENEGSTGGKSAAPIARNMIISALNNLR